MTFTDAEPVGGSEVQEAARRASDAASGAGDTPAPRRRGRPRLSDSERRERDRERKRRERATPEPEPDEPLTVTPAEVQGATILGSTAWALLGRVMGYRALEPDEGEQLGVAFAPVLKKYLPALGRWEHEINLAVTVLVLAQTTKIRREVHVDENADSGTGAIEPDSHAPGAQGIGQDVSSN